jgi:hypothetical protein
VTLSGGGTVRVRIGELLVQQGVLSLDQVMQALEFQKRDSHKRKLGECVLALKLCTEEAMLGALSRVLNIPIVDLKFEHPTPEALALISFSDADRLLMLPLRVEVENRRRWLVLAMADPTNLETIDVLQFRLGMSVRPMLSSINQVRGALIEHYRDRHALELDRPTTKGLAVDLELDTSDASWVGTPGKPSDAAELKVIAGPSAGRAIRLGMGRTLVFGRSPDVDIVLTDNRLSRRHFVVAHSGDKVEVGDLESSNGTSVNGRAVKRVTVKTGDVIEAGATKIRVTLLLR